MVEHLYYKRDTMAQSRRCISYKLISCTNYFDNSYCSSEVIWLLNDEYLMINGRH